METTFQCKVCQSELDYELEVTSFSDLIIILSPCQDCLSDAKDEGFAQGFGEGKKEALEGKGE